MSSWPSKDRGLDTEVVNVMSNLEISSVTDTFVMVFASVINDATYDLLTKNAQEVH